MASTVYTKAITMETFHPFALLHVKIFRGIFHLSEALRPPYCTCAHTSVSRSNNLRKPMLLLIVAEQISIIHEMMASDSSTH